MTFSNNSAA
ncbi:hypothetical protein GQA42_17770 [Escherichia coli]|nr:hypothetical protein GP661_16990 [Escherichia coli]MZQ05695.1 hypothetical protein [Escherichia coli]